MYIAVFVPLGIALLLAVTLALAFLLIKSPEIKYSEAVSIVKKDFGCEEILWYGHMGSITQFIPEAYGAVRSGSKCFVAMKNGKEVVVVVPDDRDQELKPFIAEWPLVLSYSEIVRRMEERGIEYRYDFDDRSRCLYIEEAKFDQLSGDFHCGANFYDRLDVKAVLTYGYSWGRNRDLHCMVTQENNEIMLYMRDLKNNELTVSKL